MASLMCGIFCRRFVQCIKTIPRTTTTFPRSSSSHINNLQGIASFVLCNCHHCCHHSPLFHTSNDTQKALRFHHTPNMLYLSISCYLAVVRSRSSAQNVIYDIRKHETQRKTRTVEQTKKHNYIINISCGTRPLWKQF